jgi:hypothetical protein
MSNIKQHHRSCHHHFITHLHHPTPQFIHSHAMQSSPSSASTHSVFNPFKDQVDVLLESPRLSAITGSMTRAMSQTGRVVDDQLNTLQDQASRLQSGIRSMAPSWPGVPPPQQPATVSKPEDVISQEAEDVEGDVQHFNKGDQVEYKGVVCVVEAMHILEESYSIIKPNEETVNVPWESKNLRRLLS